MHFLSRLRAVAKHTCLRNCRIRNWFNFSLPYTHSNNLFETSSASQLRRHEILSFHTCIRKSPHSYFFNLIPTFYLNDFNLEIWMKINPFHRHASLCYQHRKRLVLMDRQILKKKKESKWPRVSVYSRAQLSFLAL